MINKRETKIGRPPKWETPEQLGKLIQEYFDSCWEDQTITTGRGQNKQAATKRVQVRPYTITGLALALNTTRETLIEYAKKDEFSDAIKRAKLQCQNYAEQFLFSGKTPVGAIFNLKNNYGWTDTHKLETGSGTIEEALKIIHERRRNNQNGLKEHH